MIHHIVSLNISGVIRAHLLVDGVVSIAASFPAAIREKSLMLKV